MLTQGTEIYTIAGLAHTFGITARALRFYEDQGLISPIRNGLVRQYTKTDRVRIAWILRGKSVGFSLAEIGEMLDLYSLDDGRARQREVTLKKCYERITALEQQRANIDATIAELSEFCSSLENVETDPATGALLDAKTGEPTTVSSPQNVASVNTTAR